MSGSGVSRWVFVPPSRGLIFRVSPADPLEVDGRKMELLLQMLDRVAERIRLSVAQIPKGACVRVSVSVVCVACEREKGGSNSTSHKRVERCVFVCVCACVLV